MGVHEGREEDRTHQEGRLEAGVLRGRYTIPGQAGHTRTHHADQRGEPQQVQPYHPGPQDEPLQDAHTGRVREAQRVPRQLDRYRHDRQAEVLHHG